MDLPFKGIYNWSVFRLRCLLAMAISHSSDHVQENTRGLFFIRQVHLIKTKTNNRHVEDFLIHVEDYPVELINIRKCTIVVFG